MAFERAEVCRGPGRAPAAADLRRRRRRARPGSRWPGAVAELARHALAADFRPIEPTDTRVVLVEGGGRVLATVPPDLSAKAPRQLERLGSRSGSAQPMQRCDAEGVTVGDERIACSHRALGRGRDRVAGREMAGHGAGSRGQDHGHAAADASPMARRLRDRRHGRGPGAEGRPVPGIAPAAKQMGAYVGRSIDARIRGRQHPAPFPIATRATSPPSAARRRWRTWAGSSSAGFPAWVLWAAGARLVPDRLAQPAGRRLELDVELRHVRARGAVDRRFRRGEGHVRRRSVWPPEKVSLT